MSQADQKSAAARTSRASVTENAGKRTGRAPRPGTMRRALDAGAAQVRAAPLTAIAGAAAVSAGLAILLPLTRREAAVLGDVAQKLGDVARDAADGAVAIGRDQVEALGQAALAEMSGAVVHAVVSSDVESGKLGATPD
jgi:hypothetical protein